MITKKSSLNIIFVVLKTYEGISPDYRLVSCQLFIILFRHYHLTAYRACKLEFNPLFKTFSVENMLLIAIELDHLVTRNVLGLLSVVEIYQANSTLFAVFGLAYIIFGLVLLNVKPQLLTQQDQTLRSVSGVFTLLTKVIIPIVLVVLRASLSSLSSSYLVNPNIYFDHIVVETEWVQTQVVQGIKIFVMNPLLVDIGLHRLPSLSNS